MISKTHLLWGLGCFISVCVSTMESWCLNWAHCFYSWVFRKLERPGNFQTQDKTGPRLPAPFLQLLWLLKVIPGICKLRGGEQHWGPGASPHEPSRAHSLHQWIHSRAHGSSCASYDNLRRRTKGALGDSSCLACLAQTFLPQWYY